MWPLYRDKPYQLRILCDLSVVATPTNCEYFVTFVSWKTLPIANTLWPWYRDKPYQLRIICDLCIVENLTNCEYFVTLVSWPTLPIANTLWPLYRGKPYQLRLLCYLWIVANPTPISNTIMTSMTNRIRSNGAKLIVKHFNALVAEHCNTIKITTIGMIYQMKWYNSSTMNSFKNYPNTRCSGNALDVWVNWQRPALPCRWIN